MTLSNLTSTNCAASTSLGYESDVISLVVHNVQEVNSGVFSRLDTSKLSNCIHRLESISSEVFSVKLHRDILQYLAKSTAIGEFPGVWEIVRHLVKTEPYSVSPIKTRDSVHDLLSNYNLLLNGEKLENVVDAICADHSRNSAKKTLLSLLSANDPDMSQMRDAMESIESSSLSPSSLISMRLKKYRDSSTPVDRAISKMELRKAGLTATEVNQLINDVIPERSSPKVTNGKDFLLKSFGTSKWVYPGIIPFGVVTLLSGQAGSGKTAFAYDLMLSYLAGKPFLSESPSMCVSTRKRKALIINSDQPPSDAQEMLRSSPDSYTESIDFDIIESGWTLADIIELERIIQSNGYDFIVVDSYKAIHAHVPDWNENEPYAGIGIRELQRVASTYGVTIIVIHHAGHNERKGGHQSRGHSSIPDGASCVMSISSPPADKNSPNVSRNIRLLDISKIRNTEKSRIFIAFNSTNCRYELCLDNEGQKRMQLSLMCERLMPEFLIHGSNPVTPDYIMSKFATTPEQRMFVHNAIRKLEMRGCISKNMGIGDCKNITYTTVDYASHQ
jgi:hypothetical protein